MVITVWIVLAIVGWLFIGWLPGLFAKHCKVVEVDWPAAERFYRWGILGGVGFFALFVLYVIGSLTQTLVTRAARTIRLPESWWP